MQLELRASDKILLFLLCLSCLFHSGCSFLVYEILEPSQKFSDQQVPAAPNYADAKSWAALPGAEDMADVVAVGERDLQQRARVDVFFVHPTTYLWGDSWNQDLTDREVNERTGKGPLRHQASAFNSVARIFAPRYRQAVLFSFLAVGERMLEGDAALDLAYDDVSRAFRYYLRHYNDGRPIIIAGHSQGSHHCLRLLHDYFSGKKLRRRLVAAYLIGMAFTNDLLAREIPDIPLAQGPDDTHCVIVWNTVERGVRPSRFDRSKPDTYFKGYQSPRGERLACVNPLSWKTDEKWVGKERHLGAVIFRGYPNPKVDAKMIGAGCRDGLLEISEPYRKYRWDLGGDYHVMDYTLFYIDIRRNARVRVSAYFNGS